MAGIGLERFAGKRVGILGLACGLAYDVQLKRTALSWLPMAMALPPTATPKRA